MAHTIKRVLISLSLVVISSAAFAAPGGTRTTGWITPSEMDVLSRRMASQKMMPLKMECRGDSNSSFIRDSMKIRLTYGANPANKRWRWAWGPNFNTVKAQLEKNGFSQVSGSSFTRSGSGLQIRCGIFRG